MAATKYSPERSRAICEALELGTPRTHAAAAANISDVTFYDWLKTNPNFSNAVKAAEARCIQTRLERIRAAGMAGNWTADAWVLERRFPQDFGKTVQEHQLRDMSTYTDAELEAIASGASPSRVRTP